MVYLKQESMKRESHMVLKYSLFIYLYPFISVFYDLNIKYLFIY